jgi:cholesterol transport system auxiliary component
MTVRSLFPRVAIVCALLAGCGLPGGGEPAQLYDLTPKSTFDPNLPTVEWQLIVERPVASAGLNSPKIALQRTPLTLDFYARANWTDQAPQMVQTLLIESFENTSRIRAVSRESTQLRPDYVLQTELREFQAEYDSPNAPPNVHVRINGKLVRMPDRTIVASQTADRKIRAEKSDIGSVVMAFDDALGKTLKQIVEWALVAPGTTAATRSTRPAQ